MFAWARCLTRGADSRNRPERVWHSGNRLPRLFPWSITADADRKDRDIGFPLAAARFFRRQASRTDTHHGQPKIGALITSAMQRDRRKPAFKCISRYRHAFRRLSACEMRKSSSSVPPRHRMKRSSKRFRYPMSNRKSRAPFPLEILKVSKVTAAFHGNGPGR